MRTTWNDINKMIEATILSILIISFNYSYVNNVFRIIFTRLQGREW